MAAFPQGVNTFTPSGGEAAPFDPAQQMGYSMIPPSVATPSLSGMMTNTMTQSISPSTPSVPGMGAASVPMTGTGAAPPSQAIGALLSGLQGGT